jgi:GMP synthase (glutamine-hydrolysing)
MSPKRILIVRAGVPGPVVMARHGDFVRWFEDTVGPGLQMAVVDGVQGPLPAVTGCDGVVVTGSFDSVTRLSPWMEALGRWLVEVGQTVPVLGVCFGHQLLGHALGGRVERNPLGPEAGTREIELTEAGREDPLFRGLSERFLAQESHEDQVAHAPPGAVVLARNGHSPVQAFAHGPFIRGIQFHPEFSGERCRDLCREEAKQLDAARPGLAQEAEASIREAPEASQVLRNWVREF